MELLILVLNTLIRIITFVGAGLGAMAFFILIVK